jgi:hypothetical protein
MEEEDFLDIVLNNNLEVRVRDCCSSEWEIPYNLSEFIYDEYGIVQNTRRDLQFAWWWVQSESENRELITIWNKNWN